MEVSYLSPGDYEIWDRFVDHSPQGDIFCYSWWLNTVTKGDFKILAAKENGDLVAGFPLPFHSTGRINEPYLTRTLGVLYCGNANLSPQRRLAKERKWLAALLEEVPLDQFVQICMSHEFRDWLPFRWKGFSQTTRYTYLIDYSKNSIEDLWKRVAKTHREVIRKGVRNAIAIGESNDIELIYRFSCLSLERQGRIFPYSLSELKSLDESITRHGHRTIFQAVDSCQQPHAAFYVVHRPRSAYCLLSGGDDQARLTGAHTLIFWHALKHFSDRVQLINFGGSDLESIENHIRHFGGVLTPYFHIFNKNLISQPGGIRYQGKQILHHSGELFKALLKRVFT